METILLTIYALIWPLVSAGVLAVISIAFIKEYRAAKAKGEDII